VPVSQLVPYPALVVPLVYFFNATSNKKPSIERVRLLEQFFYWAGLTERYGSSTESKMSEDFNKMDAIVKGVAPTYASTELSIAPQKIAETWFSAGNGYCKAILCLLAYQLPKSFDTNGLVILDNSNLKIATSRNYHHFFPKAYLDSVDKSKEPNLIANITLIDGYSNKHRIGKKPPSEYTGKFAKTNEALADTLQTHLIRDVASYGVNTDAWPTPTSTAKTGWFRQTFAEHLEKVLGWESVYAWNQETFGPDGTLGRQDTREVVLVRDLRAALVRLNPACQPRPSTRRWRS
jgi:hypothetical protein